jgi:uridylate kinase
VAKSEKTGTITGVMSYQETIVMSVGGSLIVPDQIDTEFLSAFKNFIVNETAKSRRFIIIAGGGKTARRYQDAAAAVSELKSEDLDWLGLHATRLNGQLLRTIFRGLAHPVMVTNPDDVLDMPAEAQLIIAAGYRPGSSTDLRAIQIAERVRATKVINLSNTDYVYTDNPKTNPAAEKIETISWTDFRKLIPETWDPGLSSPFDPVAAREAERLNLEVAAINGTRLDALAAYLNNESFIGTRIGV